MGSECFQTEEEVLGVQVKAESVVTDAVTNDGRKEWLCKFCSETNVWTRWRCRCCGNNIPSGLQGKQHKQAMFAKSREWYSGSSSSSVGEEWKSQEQEEIKRLQVELLSKQQGAGRSPE